jgi:heme-degrading monooxygenase HmoA
MIARVITFHRRPERIGEVPDRFEERVAPVMRRQAGFVGAHVLVDRASGKQLGVTLWESEAAAEAAQTALNPVRDAISCELDDTAPPTTEVFDVVARA